MHTEHEFTANQGVTLKNESGVIVTASRTLTVDDKWSDWQIQPVSKMSSVDIARLSREIEKAENIHIDKNPPIAIERQPPVSYADIPAT